jgi:hypothetical protein
MHQQSRANRIIGRNADYSRHYFTPGGSDRCSFLKGYCTLAASSQEENQLLVEAAAPKEPHCKAASQGLLVWHSGTGDKVQLQAGQAFERLALSGHRLIVIVLFVWQGGDGVEAMADHQGGWGARVPCGAPCRGPLPRQPGQAAAQRAPGQTFAAHAALRSLQPGMAVWSTAPAEVSLNLLGCSAS